MKYTVIAIIAAAELHEV